MRLTLHLFAWFASLLAATWATISIVGYPAAPPAMQGPQGLSFRAERGHQHLVHLEGNAYALGLANSRLLAPLMHQQEDLLLTILFDFARTPVRAMLIQQLSLAYLTGLDDYLSPREKQEIRGLADGAPDPMPDLGGRYGRIAGYHAIHELSHRFAFDNPFFACSLVAVGSARGRDGHAYLARNFDFEGGDVFDTGKVVLAVRPTGGYGFVSVIWAGMAGVVSGINEHGLAIVLNAGASADYRRIGTPTTLLIRRALEHARNIEEALPILTGSRPFISDILGLSDATGRVAVLELTPERHALRTGDLIVATNHMESPLLRADPVNEDRALQTTTLPRRARLAALVEQRDDMALGPEELLEILRDRSSHDGHLLPLGHRHAIDAMIATHSVIFDSTAARVWVSEGPHTLGPYHGYDVRALLGASSASTIPTSYLPSLPPSPLAPLYPALRADRELLSRAERALVAGDIQEAQSFADRISMALADHPHTLLLRGRLSAAQGDAAWAKRFFVEALHAPPEYPSQTAVIEAELLHARTAQETR